MIQKQAVTVEKETRKHANSNLWFRFRAGRITASKMKLASCMDPTQPSASLIKTVLPRYVSLHIEGH